VFGGTAVTWVVEIILGVVLFTAVLVEFDGGMALVVPVESDGGVGVVVVVVVVVGVG